VAYGDARLLCRELTLEAEQITVVRRKAGETDVQLTAKGNVAYVTQQRGQVLQSQGLRLLLLSNEQISPLR
jgi:lipopolysaccharide export system protein LptA